MNNVHWRAETGSCGKTRCVNINLIDIEKLFYYISRNVVLVRLTKIQPIQSSQLTKENRVPASKIRSSQPFSITFPLFTILVGALKARDGLFLNYLDLR